jgi:UDP-N-acetylglucosamine/UDP-N-acetylgalactosamine diphosphorylase
LGAVQLPTDRIRQQYEQHGQGHVFRFWDVLDDAARRALVDQAAGIDLAELARVHASTRELAAPGARTLAPAEVERLPDRGGNATRRAEARERGEALLRAGRVACMVVAGGQGTRLGYDGPKGLYPLGPVTGRSLFALQAQKIRGARRRSGAPIPWIVMTSDATDATTRAYFAEQRWFGLPERDVLFARQGAAPALDFDGRLLLETTSRIAVSPNGHGGAFQALADAGVLDELERRGITTISYYQVDNPMIQLADPVFLGLHALTAADMSAKVVSKVDPMEKVGVLARVDGRVGVVEYTEIDDAHRFAKDERGDLLYWAGSIAIHALEVAFAHRVAKDAEHYLPYHASAKKIPYVDANGVAVKPAEPNGHKLERFLFDALPAAERVALVEVAREEEYAPLKNAEGGDSPATARAALDAIARRWLDAAGIATPADQWVEVDHARLDSIDDARAGIRRAADAGLALAPRNS